MIVWHNMNCNSENLAQYPVSLWYSMNDLNMMLSLKSGLMSALLSTMRHRPWK